MKKQTLNSTQTYDNGASDADDKYLVSLDAFDTGEVNVTRYGSALDVCLVVERTGIPAFVAPCSSSSSGTKSVV